jgi:hypothetical protein
MLRLFLSVFLVLLSISIGKSNDYARIDDYARKLAKSDDYRQMAINLTRNFTSEKDKVRAIFIWITDNIRYDIAKYYNSQATGGYTRITGRSMEEIELKKQSIRDNKIITTYRTGKGVCDDYSYLFEAMCRAAGIEAITVTGYGRIYSFDAAMAGKLVSHAWNSVKIDGYWYLLDATWAAGTIDHNTGRFTKKLQEGFFLTKPSDFILSHFPDNAQWQLLKNPISLSSFSDFPYIHDGFYDYGVSDFSPGSYQIPARLSESEISLSFKNRVPDVGVYINGRLLETRKQKTGNSINIKLPAITRPNTSVILGIVNGRYFEPIIEYLVR